MKPPCSSLSVMQAPLLVFMRSRLICLSASINLLFPIFIPMSRRADHAWSRNIAHRNGIRPRFSRKLGYLPWKPSGDRRDPFSLRIANAGGEDESSLKNLHPERETVLNYLKYIFDPDTFSERAAEIDCLFPRVAPGASSTIRSLRSNPLSNNCPLKENRTRNPLNLKIYS